jgi:hypothetical protein
MVSPRAREQVTFARTLEQALVGSGHEVYRGPETVHTVDLVIGGVASALSPGATYALVGLERIGWAIEQQVPLLLFVDDPGLNKIRTAAQSVMREPGRVFTDYLMSKRVKQSWRLGDQQRRHIELAVEMLSGETWPPVLLPLHPWASPAIAAKRLRITSEVVPLDISSMIELPEQPAGRPAQAEVWLTDRHYSHEQLEPARVRWPVIPIDSATMPDPTQVYAVARGVHQGTIDRIPGWWTPTPLYVAHARTVYLCGSEESAAIGVDTPYYLTPDHVEACSDAGHEALVEHQVTYLKETAWTNEMLSSSLTDSIGRVCSSETPGTRTATSPTS